MKKLTVLMVLSALLVFTVGASAQDIATENMKFVGGVTYNTFDGTASADGQEDEDLTKGNDLGSGFGFYVGGQYWLNNQMGIEAGYDVAKSSDSEGSETVDNTVKGPYGKVVYKLNDMIMLNGGLAYYSNEVEASDDTTSVKMFEGSGIGFLFGGDYKYPVNEKMSVVGSANYRIANLDVDKIMGSSDFDTENPKINMSGLSISGGVSYKF